MRCVWCGQKVPSALQVKGCKVCKNCYENAKQQIISRLEDGELREIDVKAIIRDGPIKS